MSQWTEAANKEWERYCNEVQALLSKTEADANEVIEDMRRHIEAELTSAGASVVTGHDVKRIIKRIGLPDVEQVTDQTKDNENSIVEIATFDNCRQAAKKHGHEHINNIIRGYSSEHRVTCGARYQNLQRGIFRPDSDYLAYHSISVNSRVQSRRMHCRE